MYFSQGNLQYIGSAATPYWKFADHQYEYLGATTGQNSNNETVDRDLFGWGTSGINDYTPIANCYEPYSTSNSNSDYKPYGSTSTHLYSNTGKADWGYNAIINGGNEVNQWRTLNRYEWVYLFGTRVTESGIRYAMGNVEGINGIILLPDNWDASNYELTNTNVYYQSSTSFTYYAENTISVEDWANVFEANGAVFLPAAGRRSGTTVFENQVNRLGFYWSSSRYDDTTAFCLYFGTSFTNGHYMRYMGNSVRLVCPVE